MISDDVVTRILLAVLLVGGGVGLYALVNRLLILRVRNTRPELPRSRSGVPAILYFTTPECVACKTIQRPALQRIKERLGDRLEVIEVDATQRPDLAGHWGVLSVPTTFILDGRGELKHINHGATRAEKLFQQVEEL